MARRRWVPEKPVLELGALIGHGRLPLPPPTPRSNLGQERHAPQISTAVAHPHRVPKHCEARTRYWSGFWRTCSLRGRCRVTSLAVKKSGRLSSDLTFTLHPDPSADTNTAALSRAGS
jgi:hypothetical protein